MKLKKCSTEIPAEKYRDRDMMTLKKISHISGFSTSTVSKALNDCYDISVDTKKLIQDIAFQYNYTPNKNAIALRKSKSNIIAVILPQVNHPIYSDTLFDIQKTASKSGYRIMLYQSFEKAATLKELFEEINDGSVDAAMVLTTSENIQQLGNIPIEYIKIFENQSQDDLKALCKINFENLLQRIK